jgi:hypothetical protein
MSMQQALQKEIEESKKWLFCYLYLIEKCKKQANDSSEIHIL